MTTFELPYKVTKLISAVETVGGTAYLAGGCVRDHLFKIKSKDIDIEIHNIAPQDLNDLLQSVTPVKSMGKSFTIWKLLKSSKSDVEIDVSIPTVDEQPVPTLGVVEACRRRDLTINSLLINLHSGDIVDPFNGLDDIKEKVLRETDPKTFIQDPLRVFRVGQFAARLECSPTPSLISLCQQVTLTDSFKNLPTERVLMELQKGWIKSINPVIAFKVWSELDAIQSYFPLISRLLANKEEQIKRWESLERVSTYRDNSSLGKSMALMWATLLYPAEETEIINLLDQMSIQKYQGFQVRKAILTSHKYSHILAQQLSTVIQNQAREDFDLEFLCAISSSCFPKGKSNLNLLEARERGLISSPLPQLIQGADLLSMGIKGVKIGEYMRRVRKDQLEEIINTRDEALALLQKLVEIDICGG